MVWEHPATSSMSSVRLVTNGRFCSGSPLDDRPDHAVANDAGAVAVVLHLVEPAVADRRLWAGGGELGRDGRGERRRARAGGHAMLWHGGRAAAGCSRPLPGDKGFRRLALAAAVGAAQTRPPP